MIWTDFHARLHQTLRQKQFLPSHQSILVAVSGGQDSLCLIKLLVDLQPKWLWTIAIAHCDHCWSSDAGIADRVEQVARSFNVSFHLAKANPPIAETEAAARKWRYQTLLKIATEKNFQYVVTGHTKSDRAETLLYNLIRGSGADGLQSLTWQRFLDTNIQLIRPLLNFTRAETLQVCQQFQLPIWEDAFNHNLKYARNRIRNELIPYLQKHFNPQLENNLAQTVEIFQAEVEYLEDEANKLCESAIEGNALNRERLQKKPLALQRRVIRQFIRLNLSVAPIFAEIEAILHLINAPNRSRTPSLPGGTVYEVRDRYIIAIALEDSNSV